MSERDLAAEIDALAKRIAAIERAATCGTGPNEPRTLYGRQRDVPCHPAQTDVGEASAESEWPRYYKCATAKTFHLGHTLVKWNGRDDKPLMCCHPSEPDRPWFSAGLEDTFAAWIREGKWVEVPRAEAESRIAVARGEKPRLDDAFPIPAPPALDDQPPFAVGQVVECVDAGVENGLENGKLYTVKATRKAANPKDAWLVDIANGGSVYAFRFRPIPATVEQGPTEGMRRAAVEICGHANHPSVAAIRSLLSTHIGPELAAKDAEIERLKEERDTEARCNAMSIEQLSAATAANVERGKLIHDILEYVEPIYGHWENGLVQRMKDVLAARDAAEGNG